MRYGEVFSMVGVILVIGEETMEEGIIMALGDAMGCEVISMVSVSSEVSRTSGRVSWWVDGKGKIGTLSW